MPQRVLVMLLSGLLLLMIGGCDSAPSATETEELYIDVPMPPVVAALGQSVQLEVPASVAANEKIIWRSSATSVAKVSSDGLLSTEGAGSATITAKVKRHRATWEVTVAPPAAVPAVATIAITPASMSVVVNGTAQLTAEARDQNGNVMADATFTWESADANIATVSAGGLVTAVAAGKVEIRAHSGGKTGTASVEVTQAAPEVTSIAVTPASATVQTGATVQLSAVAKDQNGNTMAGAPITWSTANPAVATVSATGVAWGVAAGEVAITASSGDKSASATVKVSAPAPVPVLTSITVSPASAELQVGSTRQLTATAKDQNGNTMSGVTFSWASGNTATATVSTSGLVRGVAAGAATITASSGGKSASAAVTVVAIPAPTSPAGDGIWLSASEIAALPTSGSGWNNVKSAADTDLSGGNLSIRDSHNTRVMAAAMVAVRLNSNDYRAKVRDALNSLMDTSYGTDDGLAILRRLGTYAIAADLIDLKSFDPTTDARFRAWLETARTRPYTGGGGGTLPSYHERRSNNWGQHAAASRMAVALYLGDTKEFARAVTVFRGWLGERSVYASFQWGSDLSWHADPAQPVGINPKGATKDGHNIDGVVPDDQRRCGSFAWPACKENYAYEALQGAVAAAWIAHRQGHQVFEWSDRALLRAFVWLHEQASFPAVADDQWQVWIINSAYGTSFPAQVGPAGKNVGFTEWTHAK